MRPRAAIVCRLVTGFGGATTIVLEQARRLARAGWDVDVLAARADAAAIKASGARLVRLPHWPWGSHFKRKLFAGAAARACAGRYDVVHGHGDDFICDLLSLHNCVHAAHEAIYGTALPTSDATGRFHERMLKTGRFKTLIANSQLMKRDVVARFGVDASRVRVIYPGLRADKFQFADRARLRVGARQELGFSDDDIVIGLITSGDFEKRGVPGFLAAFAKVEPAQSVRGLVMGKESRLAGYIDAARRAGLAERLRFRDAAADVERYYHACDIYAHPALFEEFGLSVLEALACGVPAVVGARVGAAEILPESFKAFVLETTSPDELAAKLSRLVRDEPLRLRLSADAAAAALGHGWDCSFQETLGLYQAILDQNGRGK